jgi:hypothetical protein
MTTTDYRALGEADAAGGGWSSASPSVGEPEADPGAAVSTLAPGETPHPGTDEASSPTPMQSRLTA